MPPRWIKEEEWLRTAGPEWRPATVAVRPPSPQEEPPSPPEEVRGAVEGSHKRFRIVRAALTFSGLGLILATLLYAFEVDQQALQAFNAPPPTIQPETKTETVGTAALTPAAAEPTPTTEQTATGPTRRMPDPILNTQQNVHGNARHGNKAHGKRLARAQHGESFGPETEQWLMDYVLFGNRKKAGGQ